MKNNFSWILTKVKKNILNYTLLAILSIIIGVLPNYTLIDFESGLGKVILFGATVLFYFLSKVSIIQAKKKGDGWLFMVIGSEMLTLMGLSTMFKLPEYTGNNIVYNILISLIIFILLLSWYYALDSKTKETNRDNIAGTEPNKTDSQIFSGDDFNKKSQIIELDDNVSHMKSTLASIKSDMEASKSDISTLKSDIEVIKSNYATQQDIEIIKTEVQKAISTQTKWLMPTIIVALCVGIAIAK
ncbi:Uncharacterised protein [Providencia alcalifaciens]|uniref:hypothetical protein n=1 Tax=Providencia alcalifaciens TaxID=126385 RepID=UPI000317031F|nr:hypothetical protein [Providencia alcalifaciens]SQI34918.1 Uncharacterised protein [Providencia alcalifaciens]